MAKLYDIAILGATPAGWAAAATLTKSSHGSRQTPSVIVLDTPGASAGACPLSNWFPNTLLKPLLHAKLPKAAVRPIQGQPFRTVCYHDATLHRQAAYSGRSDLGFFVKPGALEAMLKTQATKAGVLYRRSTTPADIQLFEDHIELRASRTYRAKLLLIAQGQPASLLAEIGKHTKAPSAASHTVAGLDLTLTPAQRRSRADKLLGALHVVEMAERSEAGLFFYSGPSGSTLHLRLISTSKAAGNRAEELTRLLAKLQEAGLAPADLSLQNARGAVWRPEAGTALEMEIHAAKRCLLIGSAGGFAESITAHETAPSVASGVLAAQVAAEALDSETPQATLMEFHARWRDALADALRPPSTSLSMLLPLLFINKRMVSKFTRAMLFGEEM